MEKFKKMDRADMRKIAGGSNCVTDCPDLCTNDAQCVAQIGPGATCGAPIRCFVNHACTQRICEA